MRRSTIIAAFALPAALTAAAALAEWLPSARLAHLLEKRLCTSRGVSCAVGSAHVSLLPWPSINARDITVALGERPGVASAARLNADMALLPLLTGKVVFSTLTIEGADIVVDTKALRGAGGTAMALIDGLAAQEQRWANLPVERVRVSKGRILDLQKREWASDAELRIELPRNQSALSVNASARWRGELVRTTVRLSQPRALIAGGRSDLLAGFTAPLLSTSVEGIVTGGPLTQINGTFTAASPNPAALAVWLDENEMIWPPFAISTAGQARLARDLTVLTMNKFTVGKTDLEGNVAFRRDSKGIQITGTLAAERLDIPWSTTPPRAAMQEGEREFVPLLKKQLIAADLRLSAASATIGDITLSNVGLALIARDRKIDLVLAGADYAGGRAKARLGVTIGDERVDARLQAHLEALDLAKALAPIGAKRMNGVLSAQAQLDARGSSSVELLRGLEGKATISVQQGDLVGINVPEILRRIEKRPLLTALDIRGGRTPFETASATIKISNGVAEINDGAIVSPATQIDITGTLQLPERTLALKGIAAPNRAEGAMLPFEIKGSFDEPTLIPDARALIRRSGAAAPFFGTTPKSPPQN